MLPCMTRSFIYLNKYFVFWEVSSRVAVASVISNFQQITARWLPADRSSSCTQDGEDQASERACKCNPVSIAVCRRSMCCAPLPTNDPAVPEAQAPSIQMLLITRQSGGSWVE